MSRELRNRTSDQEQQDAGNFLKELARGIRMALGADEDDVIIDRGSAARIMKECEEHAAALALRDY